MPSGLLAAEWIAGGGVRYAFTKKITVALGYKYDTFKSNRTKIKDTFSGVTFDAVYSFD